MSAIDEMRRQSRFGVPPRASKLDEWADEFEALQTALRALLEQWRGEIAAYRTQGAEYARQNDFHRATEWAECAVAKEECADELEAVAARLSPPEEP